MTGMDYPLTGYKQWLDERERFKTETIEQYCSPARRLQRFVTEGELTLGNYRDWIQAMQEEGLASSTINTYHAQAKKYLQYLDVDFSPGHAVGELPDYDPDSLPDPLSPDDVRAIRGGCENPEEMAVVVLLYHTALRNSELRSIKWEHVDTGAEELTVMRRKKKGWGRDTLPLYEDQLSTIEGLREWRDDDNPYLFPARGGPQAPGATVALPESEGKMSDSTLRNRVNAIVDRSTVDRDVWPHLFRHTRATHMLRESGDLDYVNQWCDHDNYETTLRYARLSGDNLRREGTADSGDIFD